MPHRWGAGDAYPLPRKRDAAATAAAGIAELRPPRSRQWVAILSANGVNLRSTASSPRFVGPAIIKHVNCEMTTPASAGALAGVSIRWSDAAAPGETNVARSPLPAGNPIFETTGDPTGDNKFFGADFWRRTPLSISGTRADVLLLNHLIMAPEFFLNVTIFCEAGGTAADMSFLFSILENIDRDLIPDLLG